MKASTKIVIGAGAGVIVALCAVIVVLLNRPAAEPAGGGMQVGYSAEAKVFLDQDSLQAAVDEAQRNAEEGMVALEYQNDANSTDGRNFTCYIANAPENLYDMFLTIYADSDMTDQIFLSGLVPPGSGFDHITLDHALEKGDHTVNVVVTQVTSDENGNQAIKNQVVHTIEFHVA